MVNYLSPESFKRMKDELHQLLSVERPKIVASVSAAAAMGDRSENAEYIYGKRRLREIDRRVRFLQQRLQNAEVVNSSTLSTHQVAFGLFVELEDEEGSIMKYQIVGPDDIDLEGKKITYTSPLGRALLGKKIGEEVKVVTPKGNITYEIIKITHSAEY